MIAFALDSDRLRRFAALSVLSVCWLSAFAATAASAGDLASAAPGGGPAALASEKDRLSYALGMNLAQRLRRGAVEVEPALIARGFMDALAGEDTLLSEDEVRALLTELAVELEQRRASLRTARQKDGEGAEPEVADIRLSFKLDPRLTRSLYMGDRWVVPTTTYTQIGDEDGVAVEARVLGVDGSGQPVVAEAEWEAADPDMVTISAGSDEEVTINVLREGRTSVRVTAQGVARTLAVTASRANGVIRVDIDPGQVSRAAG